MQSAVAVAPGQQRRLTVLLRNEAASQVRGEAQLLCPREIWPITASWSQGFAVTAGAEHELSFSIDVPIWFRPGTYWAVVKVTSFGRRRYSEAVPIEVLEGG